MRALASLIAAILAAFLTLTACAPAAPAGPGPQRDTPDRGGDHGGGDGMM
jgi:hypothetical protein